MTPYRIGIDLGGTKTEAVLLAPDETELYRTRIPTPTGNDYYRMPLFWAGDCPTLMSSRISELNRSPAMPFPEERPCLF